MRSSLPLHLPPSWSKYILLAELTTGIFFTVVFLLTVTVLQIQMAELCAHLLVRKWLQRLPSAAPVPDESGVHISYLPEINLSNMRHFWYTGTQSFLDIFLTISWTCAPALSRIQSFQPSSENTSHLSLQTHILPVQRSPTDCKSHSHFTYILTSDNSCTSRDSRLSCSNMLSVILFQISLVHPRLLCYYDSDTFST